MSWALCLHFPGHQNPTAMSWLRDVHRNVPLVWCCLSLSLLPEQIPTERSQETPENPERWQWTTSNTNGEKLWDTRAAEGDFFLFPTEPVGLQASWDHSDGVPKDTHGTGLSTGALWFPSPRKITFCRMWEHCLHPQHQLSRLLNSFLLTNTFLFGFPLWH